MRKPPIAIPARQQVEEDRQARALFESDRVYDPRTICGAPDEDSPDFATRLLNRKLDIVRRHYRGGLVLDLCCATGSHLFHLAPLIERGIGIDFSTVYAGEAQQQARVRGHGHLSFVCGNARHLPLASGSVALLYSLSALYVIPQVEDVFAEVARVLRPGGRCVLDLGNRWSLNAICTRAYPEIATTFYIGVGEMKRLCRQNGLRIVEHRAFQLLPLWADRPRWLYPLLHPGWKRLMSRRLGDRMLDEWISTLPLLERVAFRHLLVCERNRAAAASDGI
jgi:SAM-dependent methyltransferase